MSWKRFRAHLEPWIDHFPLWVSLASVISSDFYDPSEWLVMAFPLLVAAWVQIMQWRLESHRWVLELIVVLILVLDWFLGRGLLATAVLAIFLLSGIRLMTPGHRPQVLLMAFLVFLTTSVTDRAPTFLFWCLLWMASAMLFLFQHNWRKSVALQKGATSPVPLTSLWRWGTAALGLAVSVFLLMPRLSGGLNPLPLGLAGRLGNLMKAGLSDRVELGGSGPIEDNPEVVMRIHPPTTVSPTQIQNWAHGLDLLRGMCFERLEEQRWVLDPQTPTEDVLDIWRLEPPQVGATESQERSSLLSHLQRARSRFLGERRQAEFSIHPTPSAIIPVPYQHRIAGLPENRISRMPGGTLRWTFLQVRPAHLKLEWYPGRHALFFESGRDYRSWDHLTFVPENQKAVRRLSQQFQPKEPSPQVLAESMTSWLRGHFQYTLQNPSGSASNPLEHFLTRSKAGHCEYFASALALMLRSRGVPARLVNGYRLGAYNQDGHYFRVTQNEAHAWVEYWDAELKAWRVADPTPSAGLDPFRPPSGLMGAFGEYLDLLRFRWERYVVRFSDADQVAGLNWVRLQSLKIQAPKGIPGWIRPVFLLTLLVLIGLRWRKTFSRPKNSVAQAQGLKLFRPLLRRTQEAGTPEAGETLEHWLGRLAQKRPERAQQLTELSRLANQVLYAQTPPQMLEFALRQEVKAWKGWKPPLNPISE